MVASCSCSKAGLAQIYILFITLTAGYQKMKLYLEDNGGKKNA